MHRRVRKRSKQYVLLDALNAPKLATEPNACWKTATVLVQAEYLLWQEAMCAQIQHTRLVLAPVLIFSRRSDLSQM